MRLIEPLAAMCILRRLHHSSDRAHHLRPSSLTIHRLMRIVVMIIIECVLLFILVHIVDVLPYQNVVIPSRCGQEAA